MWKNNEGTYSLLVKPFCFIGSFYIQQDQGFKAPSKLANMALKISKSVISPIKYIILGYKMFIYPSHFVSNAWKKYNLMECMVENSNNCKIGTIANLYIWKWQKLISACNYWLYNKKEQIKCL